MGNITADQSVLADYRLFLRSLEEDFPGLREEMCQIAAKDPQMNELLSQLNSKYLNFCSARNKENMLETQLAAASAIDILKQLSQLGVVPYFKSKASRMQGVTLSGFTFIKQEETMKLVYIHEGRTRTFNREFTSLHDAERTIEAFRELSCITSIMLMNEERGMPVFLFGPTIYVESEENNNE